MVGPQEQVAGEPSEPSEGRPYQVKVNLSELERRAMLAVGAAMGVPYSQLLRTMSVEDVVNRYQSMKQAEASVPG